MKTKQALTVGLLAGITIGLFFWYAVPTMSDDVMYRFKWQQAWQLPFERIQSLHDVIASQIVHYQCVNGRSITHTIAQIMMNLVPDAVTKGINTLMFVLLIFLTARLAAKSKESRYVIAVIVFAMIFLLFSGFYTAFIWMPYTYLWALVFTVCFLLMLKWLNKRTMSCKHLPLLGLSFAAGWSHEAIALPLSVAFCCYMAVNWKTMLRRADGYCMAAYILGTMMIITSPALWFRADIEGITLTERMLYGCINLVSYTRISWLMLATLACILIKDRQQFIGTIRAYRYPLIAWTAAIGIVCACGTTIERVSVCADFIAMIIVLSVWQGEKLIRLQKTIAFVVTALVICIAIPAIKLNRENHDNFYYHHRQLLQTDSQLIKIRQLPAKMPLMMELIRDRYVCPTVEYHFYNCYMAFDRHDTNNMAVAQLYGKPSVVMLPEDVVDKINSDSAAYMHYEPDEHNDLYIQQVSQLDSISNVTFLLNDETDIRFYQKLLSYKGYEYEIDPFKYELLDIGNRRYLVMTIPPSNIRRRIRDISIR